MKRQNERNRNLVQNTEQFAASCRASRQEEPTVAERWVAEQQVLRTVPPLPSPAAVVRPVPQANNAQEATSAEPVLALPLSLQTPLPSLLQHARAERLSAPAAAEDVASTAALVDADPGVLSELRDNFYSPATPLNRLAGLVGFFALLAAALGFVAFFAVPWYQLSLGPTTAAPLQPASAWAFNPFAFCVNGTACTRFSNDDFSPILRQAVVAALDAAAPVGMMPSYPCTAPSGAFVSRVWAIRVFFFCVPLGSACLLLEACLLSLSSPDRRPRLVPVVLCTAAAASLVPIVALAIFSDTFGRWLWCGRDPCPAGSGCSVTVGGGFSLAVVATVCNGCALAAAVVVFRWLRQSNRAFEFHAAALGRATALEGVTAANLASDPPPTDRPDAWYPDDRVLDWKYDGREGQFYSAGLKCFFDPKRRRYFLLENGRWTLHPPIPAELS